MATHQLKIWPEFFQAVERGDKTFEVRKADRPFAVGDTLELQEFAPGLDGGFTGREVDVRVTYVLPGGAFGIADGYSVLGIARLATPELVALGERAKEWAERTGRGKTTIVERDRLLSAARLYAQSIKGEDHGK